MSARLDRARQNVMIICRLERGMVEKAGREVDFVRRGNCDGRCGTVAEAVRRNAISESCLGALRDELRNRTWRQGTPFLAEPKRVIGIGTRELRAHIL